MLKQFYHINFIISIVYIKLIEQNSYYIIYIPSLIKFTKALFLNIAGIWANIGILINMHFRLTLEF